MKTRFILFQRAGIFYCEDTTTGKQSSLRTRDETEARTVLNAKNEACRQPVLNLQIARAYLSASDPAFLQRTWQMVMDQIQTHGRDSTKTRYVRGMKSSAFDGIRRKTLLETTPEDFFAVLENDQMSVGHYLRRLHNLALNLGWLPIPVLAPKLWPIPQSTPKRAITQAEHLLILAAEKNAEQNLYYQLLWEVGASQNDAAAAETIGKLSIVGVGMKSHTGVAGKLFETLGDEGVNIDMISTSEIKISVVIELAKGEQAMKAIDAAFMG